MNYFEALNKEVEKLDALSNSYMNGKTFIPSDEMAGRVYVRAEQLFDEAKGDWDKLPWWASEALDGWVPFTPVDRPGSLFRTLSLSVAARDARLRNLLEIAEGRETQELDFPVRVIQEVFDEEFFKNIEKPTVKKKQDKKKRDKQAPRIS